MREMPGGVVLVTRNFPPLRGGMERLNQRMLGGLAAVAPTGLVGPTGCSPFAPSTSIVCEATSSRLWIFLLTALLKTLAMAIRTRPRFVLAGSGLTAPLAWLAARISGARCAVYVHGLDLVVQNRIYQCLWLPFIRRCDTVIANSSNTSGLAVACGVQPERICVVHPGTSLPAADPEARDRFRSAFELDSGPLLLSVGRLTPRKGLEGFVRNAFPAIMARRPDARLLVIGEDATDALTGSLGSERARIDTAARQSGVAHALRFLHHCDDATLSDAYRAADVHVFPVCETPGDVEGFGMVAIEAAAHGLSTVAFRVGGVPDAVIEGSTGTLVDPGDHVAFAEEVLRLLEVSSDSNERASRTAISARKFGWENFDRSMADVLLADEPLQTRDQ